MRTRDILLPRYYSGPVGTNNSVIRASVAGVPSVSGSTIVINQYTGGFVSSYTNNARAETIAAVSLAIVAGSDTVLETVTCNGEPGFVACQINAGGYISAIVYGRMRGPAAPYVTSGTNSEVWRVVVTCSGTAPTSVRNGFNVLSSDGLIAALTASDVANTALTVTLPQVPRRSYMIAVAVNDVGTANSCTWSGTANNISEADDAALGSARMSNATTQNYTWQAEGSGATVTATFAVSSSSGISLACAVFDNDIIG